MEGISVFVVTMLASAAECLSYEMVRRGWSVARIPSKNGTNDLVEFDADSFSSIVQFGLKNDPSEKQIERAFLEVKEILDSNGIKYYALFVGKTSGFKWTLGNVKKPSNVVPFGPYRDHSK